MHDSARAEPLLQQALKIYKQGLGDDHLTTIDTVNELGTLYLAMHDFARAEPLLERALAVRKNVLGEMDTNYGQSVSNLGACTSCRVNMVRRSHFIARA